MNEDFFEEKTETGEAAKEVPSVPVVRPIKKDNTKIIAVIMCIVCAVFGGIVGGIISGNVVKNGFENETTTLYASNSPETSNSASQTSTNENVTAAGTTVPAVTESATNSGTYTSADDKPSLNVSLSAKEIYSKNVDSVVSIEVRDRYATGYGTGFIVSEEGYIVTNYHVVEDAESVYVTLYDESQYAADIIGYEEENDLAVIKIEPKGNIESLVYGKSSDLSVGDNVYVIGNPLGDLTFTLTKGVVSALNRLIDTGNGFTINMFQTDAAVNSGNSGGPVFDEHGYVVGIASAKYASSSIEGLSFCVPIDDVRSMIDEIISKGYVSGKPLMGVTVYDKEITNYGFIQSSRSINGAKVMIVESGSAAEKAGLIQGDIIVAVGSETVTSVSELRTALSDYRSGDTVTLKVNRNGSYLGLELTFDEYEPSQPRTDYSYAYDL